MRSRSGPPPPATRALLAALATRGRNHVGRQLRLDHGADRGARGILEDRLVELPGLIGLAIRLEETRQRETRVRPKRAIDRGRFVVGLAGTIRVAGRLAGARQPDQRFLAQEVLLRGPGQKLAV